MYTVPNIDTCMAQCNDYAIPVYKLHVKSCRLYMKYHRQQYIEETMSVTAAAVAFQSARFGEGQGPILLDDIHCAGNETSLLQCTHGGIRNHNCGHHEDASVACLNCKS